MKKRVRFDAGVGQATPLEPLACRGAPTESINLDEFLFPDDPSTTSNPPFTLRLHLGVLRSTHTYYACVLVTASFPITIDPILPSACESAADLTAFVRNTPAEAVPDVCVLAMPPNTLDESPLCVSPPDLPPNATNIHFLITPKEQGLFTYNLKLIVHDAVTKARSGFLEVKVIGNSLEIRAGKPSIREGVRLFVSRGPPTESAN